MNEHYTSQKILVFQITKCKAILILKYKKNKISRFLVAKAYIGRNGTTLNKIEGDKKTPLGTYKLGLAFGTHRAVNTKLQYIKLKNSNYWVDDSNSKYYNELVDICNIDKDWETAEHLLEYKNEYEYAIEIKYNNKKTKEKGSAIFLHCSVKKPTSGCIAISKEKMIKVLKKLDKNAIISIYGYNI